MSNVIVVVSKPSELWRMWRRVTGALIKGRSLEVSLVDAPEPFPSGVMLTYAPKSSGGDDPFDCTSDRYL